MLELSGVWLSIAIAFATHFVADFGFQQSDWMALGKSKSWEILTYHVTIYTSIFALVAHFSPLLLTWQGVLWIFVTHFLCDTFVKGRYGLTDKIWLDQLTHLATLVIAILIGWL